MAVALSLAESSDLFVVLHIRKRSFESTIIRNQQCKRSDMDTTVSVVRPNFPTPLF